MDLKTAFMTYTPILYGWGGMLVALAWYMGHLGPGSGRLALVLVSGLLAVFGHHARVMGWHKSG